MFSFWWGPSFDLQTAAFLIFPHMENKEERERESLHSGLSSSLYKIHHINFQSIILFSLDFDLTISGNHCPLSDTENVLLVFCADFIAAHWKNWVFHFSLKLDELKCNPDHLFDLFVCPSALSLILFYSRRLFNYCVKFLVHFLFPMS